MTVVSGISERIRHVYPGSRGLAHNQPTILALLDDCAADRVTRGVSVNGLRLLDSTEAGSVEFLTISIGVVGEVLLGEGLLVPLVVYLRLVLVVHLGLRVVEPLREHNLIVAFVVGHMVSSFVLAKLSRLTRNLLLSARLHQLPL